MISIDTNVVVRVVTRDDPAQAEAAAGALRSGPLWLAKSVLLETEWVLRGAYGLQRETIHDALRKLAGLRNLRLEDGPAVLQALDGYAAGLDFADALHLASSLAADRFVTFDRALVQRARRLETLPKTRLLSP
jgi:predicted nucleic-acid-binding protein